MDALPPSPPAYVYAATDYRPRGAREVELCASASHIDYLYMGTVVLSFAASIYTDVHFVQYARAPGVRLVGPALVGLTWGGVLGGGYLAQPKCSPDWVVSEPPEGNFRLSWPLAAALGLLAGASAPILMAYETGPVPYEWPVWERSSRVLVAAAAGFLGALLPYALPPKTWRAAKELEKIRARGDSTGAFVSYTLKF